MAILITPAIIPTNRVTNVHVGRGFKGWSYDAAQQNATQIPQATVANAALCSTLMSMLQGDVVTDIYVWASTTGSTLTYGKVAIFTWDGQTQLAISNDNSTDLAATGGNKFVKFTLTSPYTFSADQLVFFSFMQMGVTGARVYARNGILNPSSLIGAGSFPLSNSYNTSTYSAIPATFTPTGGAAWMVWFAWD